MAQAAPRYSPVGSNASVKPKLDSQPTVYVPPALTVLLLLLEAEPTDAATAVTTATTATAISALRRCLCMLP